MVSINLVISAAKIICKARIFSNEDSQMATSRLQVANNGNVIQIVLPVVSSLNEKDRHFISSKTRLNRRVSTGVCEIYISFNEI
jgi:hypothetical protein